MDRDRVRRIRRELETQRESEREKAPTSSPSSLKTHATLIQNFTLTNFPRAVTRVADNLIEDACAGMVILYFRREQQPQTSNDNVSSCPASNSVFFFFFFFSLNCFHFRPCPG